MKKLLQHLRRAVLLSDQHGLSDAQLLDAFLRQREEAAFEAMLRRHGPMVLGVCRRILGNCHDAEDAFQATFLVLARKAGGIRSSEVLASWLYGVAHRTALKARAMNVKRRIKERELSSRQAAQQVVCEELIDRLDDELSRLHEKYRVPIVLCELEGRSRKEVARTLGIPEGTLSWRLAQAKKTLAKKLARHRPAISGCVLTAALSPNVVSASLLNATAKTVLEVGAVPAPVLVLTEGVLKAMLLSKLKITVCAAGLMLLGGIGVSGLTYRATAQQPSTRSAFGVAPESRPLADDLESLRLEMEAVRKSLQATRERVKALELEVRILKSPRAGGPGVMMGGMGMDAPTADKHAPKAEDVRGSLMRGDGKPATKNTGNSALPTRASSSEPTGQPGGQSVPRSSGAGRESMPDGGNFAGPNALRRGHQGQSGTASSPSLTPTTNSNRSADIPLDVAPRANGNLAPATPADPFLDRQPQAADLMDEAEAALKKLRRNPSDKQATATLERALKRLKERDKRRPTAPEVGP